MSKLDDFRSSVHGCDQLSSSSSSFLASFAALVLMWASVRAVTASDNCRATGSVLVTLGINPFRPCWSILVLINHIRGQLTLTAVMLPAVVLDSTGNASPVNGKMPLQCVEL